AALDLHDPGFAPAGNRSAFLVALGLKLSAALTQPRLAAFGAGHEPLRVKLKLDLFDDLLARRLPRFALGLQPVSGRLQRRAAALPGAQLLRQLIPARVPETLILFAVGLLGLLED